MDIIKIKTEKWQQVCQFTRIKLESKQISLIKQVFYTSGVVFYFLIKMTI